MPAKPLVLLLALLVLPLGAEVATRATAVLAQPRADAPVLQLIKAGETLPEVAAVSAPAGWIAVTVKGPHEVYVENKYIGKDLDVKPGSPLHTQPKTDAPVLASLAAGDAVEITGLRGRWTQLRLTKGVTGYVPGEAPAPVTVVTQTGLRDIPNPATATGTPSAAPAARPAVTGRAVERTDAERQSLAALPRLFEGTLVSTRVAFRPRRPHDFALQAEDGTRFAYVDLSKLLLTEQIEKYLDRQVVVYGVARPVPDAKDIVIAVESLQLR